MQKKLSLEETLFSLKEQNYTDQVYGQVILLSPKVAMFMILKIKNILI